MGSWVHGLMGPRGSWLVVRPATFLTPERLVTSHAAVRAPASRARAPGRAALPAPAQPALIAAPLAFRRGSRERAVAAHRTPRRRESTTLAGVRRDRAARLPAPASAAAALARVLPGTR